MPPPKALLLVLLAGIAAFAAAGAPSAAAPDARGRPAVDPVANELWNYGARSVLVHVSVRGRTHAAAAGSGAPRTRDDRFRVGSVTKTFVASIVLQLVEERRLRLDDAVERHLPGSIPLGDRITLRQLLNHTSGIANYTDYPDWLERAERSRTLRPIDVLEFAAAKPREFGRPGGAWAYSNTNYVALGLVIEKVTGHRLRHELARRIVRPLGLERTELAATRRIPGLRDAGTNPNVPWAAGGVVSSARDLVRFFSALLSGRVVSRASLKRMQQAVAIPNTPGRYGLGLEPADLPCDTFWGNGGSILDYRTFVAASADGRRVAVVLLRGRSDRPPALASLLCT